LLGILWGAWLLPVFWRESTISQFSTRIVRGETFAPSLLQRQLTEFESKKSPFACTATEAHSKAVIELSLLNRGFSGPPEAIDDKLSAARKSIIDGLSCLPSDAYLWFALFQVESLRSGFNPEYLRYLEMSYKYGPNEGWIAIPRNRAAFAIFEGLPPTLQTKVLDEFALLLRTELYAPAIDIFLGAAAPYRETVVKHLATVPEKNRQLFAVHLGRMGIDAAIPGISTFVRGPWQH
jgi:hypothetical protein